MTRSSPATRLPLEVVQMVTVHLINDTRGLLACSLTCYSWYIAAVPYLHRTLTISDWYSYPEAKLLSPKILRSTHRLGLLPLVKTFRIRRGDPGHFSGFSPERFSYFSLRHFRALTNVQELGIDHLDIPSFMPSAQMYFGHFFPTLRYLAMGEPKGSYRQILYFVGLFQHLEDLKILYDKATPQEKPEDDVTPIPPFVPPLRGRLTLCSTEGGLLKDMVDLFGGIRFRHLDIFNVRETQPLLNACAETLETLRLYPTDPYGKKRSLDNTRVLVDGFIACVLRNLSCCKVLRTLEIRTRYLDRALRTCTPLAAASFLTHALLTIKSPFFFEVIVIYRDFDFGGVGLSWSGSAIRSWFRSSIRLMPGDEATMEASQHTLRFATLQNMHKARSFQLVLCVDVWEGVGDYAVRSLEEAVAAERAKGGFSWVSPEPLVIYKPRRSRQSHVERRADPPVLWIFSFPQQ